MFVYVLLLVTVVTKKIYSYMISKGISHNVAVYFNRKIIHMLSGGVIASILPFVFTEPFVPMVFAYILGLAVYIPHRRGNIYNWFQTEDNIYEVNFCFAWGTSIAVLWIVTGDPLKSILPALAISFGDAVTGIVRNIVFGYRTKHWIGNIAMFAMMIPIGYALSGLVGALAMGIASIVERFEFNPIDDNILIALTVTIIVAFSAIASF